MPTVNLSPVFNGQTVTGDGVPADGYKLYTYAAGSTTEQATYTDSSGTSAHTNPIILDPLGYPTNSPIWLQSGLTYKFILKDTNDVQVGLPLDNISGVNDTTSTISQWIGSGLTPTYISTTSFSLAGDQTSEFHVGRRLQFSTTAGTVYGTIKTSAYTTLTTVTVIMDSGTLDSGLSVVNLSILRYDHLAVPNVTITASRVVGLLGNVNASTPLTKYDISANSVTFKNSSGYVITQTATGTLTCDLGAAGSVINGRDQSGAFTANSWIYLYFIWNGTTIASLASTTAPASFTGSTLPTGYTHWAFATALRWNGSSNIVPMYARGSRAFYDTATVGVIRALASGVETSFTAVSLSSFIPPNALYARLTFTISLTHNTASINFNATYRTTGSSGNGAIGLAASSQVANVQINASNSFDVATNSSQQIDYQIASTPSGSGGLIIDMLGFAVPNGDA